jgi:hypothetical protein
MNEVDLVVSDCEKDPHLAMIFQTLSVDFVICSGNPDKPPTSAK